MDSDVTKEPTHVLHDPSLTGDAAPNPPHLPLYPPSVPVWRQLRPPLEFHLLRYAQVPTFLAPLTAPQVVVDIGCGSGQWMHSMGQIFPQATIVGLDRTRRLTALTPNGRFMQTNVLEPLPLADASCDYVHLQFMSPSIPIDRWFVLLRECLRILRPQGWLELVELGIPQISHPTIWVWIAKLGRYYGYELFPGKALGLWLTHIGGAHVKTQEERVIRGVNMMTSSRLMIRDGIALAELFRDEVVARGIASARDYDRELQIMQQNLFRTGRQDCLAISVGICQRR